MSNGSREAPTQPLPTLTEPPLPRLPLGRLAAAAGAAMCAGALLTAGQLWRMAHGGEPEPARIVAWCAASGCLLAGAVALIALAGAAVWTAITAVNLAAAQRRAYVEQAARVARSTQRARMRDEALRAARAVATARPPVGRGRLEIVKDAAPTPCRNGDAAHVDRTASGQ